MVRKKIRSIPNVGIHLLSCTYLILSNFLSKHSYGEKDPDYKEFRLGKCITYTLGCLTVRGWSVTPTTNAARVAFVM